MPENRRLTLGPELSSFLGTLPDQSATSLDREFQSLLQSRDRVADLEAERAANMKIISSLLQNGAEMSSALSETSTSVSRLTDLIDHRTREMVNIFLHISTLVGTNFTEGEERERLHRRFEEIFQDIGTHMEALSGLVKDQQHARETLTNKVIGRAEEGRLAIAENEMTPAPRRDQNTRGMER
jgi:chromosome segregation ATPase